ncbi:MAG: PhnD/SsuA/transferrin family substrate-binding protein [Pseudomonadota bacterium]
MIAALPMYDWLEVRGATDALWQGIARHLAEAGLAAPPALDRRTPLWQVWQAPDLLLAQTCGWPLTMGEAGTAAVFARPILRGDGAPGTYRSALVMRADDRRSVAEAMGGGVAVNGFASLSGWITLQRHARRRGWAIGPIRLTGGHRASLSAVADGEADLAAVDATCWHIAEQAGLTRTLDVRAWTEPAPSPPWITAATTEPEVRALLATAIDATLQALPEVAERLGLRGALPATNADYDGLADWAGEGPAARAVSASGGDI